MNETARILARLPSTETSFSNTSVLLKGTGSTLIPLSFHCHQQIFLNLTTMRRRHSRTRQKLASMLKRRAPKLITFDGTGTLFGLKASVGDLYVLFPLPPDLSSSFLIRAQTQLSLAEEFANLKKWGPNLPCPKILNESFIKHYKLLDTQHPNFGKGDIHPKIW